MTGMPWAPVAPMTSISFLKIMRQDRRVRKEVVVAVGGPNVIYTNIFGGAHSAHISKTRRMWLGLSYPEVGMRTPPVASATQVCYTVQQTLQHSWERNVAEGTYRGRRRQDRGRILRSLRTTSVMIRTHDLTLVSKIRRCAGRSTIRREVRAPGD